MLQVVIHVKLKNKLKMIKTLEERYNVPIDILAEVGIPTTVAAAAIGACMIERHITLDRSMWGLIKLHLSNQ